LSLISVQVSDKDVLYTAEVPSRTYWTNLCWWQLCST